MLICLEERGYVMREEHSTKYMLSLKMYTLAHRHSPVDEIRHAAIYPMQELALRLKQSCHLGVFYNDQLMVIYQAKSPSPIALSIEEGSLFSLMQTASGRTLLAFLSEDQRRNILNRLNLYKSYFPRQQVAFLQALGHIREKGGAVGHSELTKGITDIVKPIGNSETGLFGALAVSLLTTEYDEMLAAEGIMSEAEQCARTILTRLGF